LKLHSDGGVSGNKKCKRDYGGVWRSLRLAGVCSLESGGRFFVGAFDRNLASVAMKIFSHLIHFVKKCYKCCTVNAICEENAEINYVAVQHKKVYSRQL
jgi:hypothetical protein